MVKIRDVRQPAVMICIRSLLWTLICAAFIFFFWALFARPTYWYGNDTSGHFAKMWHGMEVPLRALQSQVKNVDSPVMGGENHSMVSVCSPMSKTPDSALKSLHCFVDATELCARHLQLGYCMCIYLDLS